VYLWLDVLRHGAAPVGIEAWVVAENARADESVPVRYRYPPP
jgi:hypothetical protein